MTFTAEVEPASLKDDVVWTIGSENIVLLENCKEGSKTKRDTNDVLGRTVTYWRDVVLKVPQTGDGKTCQALIQSEAERVPCYVSAYLKDHPEINDRVLLSYNSQKGGQPME